MALKTEMYTDGEYLHNNPSWDVEDSPWKARIIHDLITRNHIKPAEVTEVGCGAGGILEELSRLEPSIKLFKGYDISPQAIKLAQQREQSNLLFFQEDFIDKDETGDLILVIDVVEHIADYYGFLQKLREKGTHFIFHIPMDASCRTLLKPWVMKQQRDAVGHLHYFSEEMIWWFLQDTGYDVVDWVYTKPVTDTQKSKSVKQGLKKVLRNFSFSIHKSGSVKLWGGYSLMILAK